MEHASSLSGKIKLTFYAGEGPHASKTVNVGKLAQQLDHSEIFGKVSFDVKKSWFKGFTDIYQVCAYSKILDIQQCTNGRDNGKKTQTILVQVPNEGDHDEDGDF